MGRSNPAASRASASRSSATSKQSAAAASSTAAVATPATPAAALSAVSSSLGPVLDSPSSFFAANQSLASTCLASTKELYDLAKSVAPAYLDNPASVPRLLTSAAFDSEQVFQQLSKHTGHVLSNMNLYMSELKKSVALQKKEQQRLMQEAMNEEDEEEGDDEELGAGQTEDDLDADLDEPEEDAENAEEEEEGEDAEEDGEDAEEEEEEEEADSGAARAAKPAGAYKGRGGVEEDAFFSLDDMEKFADQFEDDNDAGDIDLNGSDEEGANMDDEEEGAEDDEEEEDDDEDEAMDVGALARRAIRTAHEKTLKPLSRPLREEEIDLEEDVGEIDADRAERYADFFDPPAPELVKGSKSAVGKRGAKAAVPRAGQKARSMADHYAAEDADEDTYQDEDYTDEFGGAFKQLASKEREGLLGGKAGVKRPDDDEDDEAELAASAPVDGSAPAAAASSEANLSNYEKSSRKLLAQISTLEQKIVAPREWAQLGEVSGKARPVDALLSTNLEFEHAGKVAKPITQEYTEELEALIKRRILAEQFDDVVRRTESDLPAGQRKKSQQAEVSDEKSAVGLGDVYAAEAAASLDAASGRASVTDEKTAKLHKDLSEHMADLCHKLDALCNFHFTPRSIHADELAVRTHAGGAAGGSDKPKTVSSIRMEDVMPSHMSSAAAIAPQEAYTLSAQAMVGATERSAEEKGASRRRHKAQKKKKSEALAAKEKAHIDSLGAAGRGNAAEGILRKAISSKEMAAATSARNVISAGGAGAPGGSGKKKGGGAMVGHGANTKFSSSGAFFGKMQGVAQQDSAKKQRTK